MAQVTLDIAGRHYEMTVHEGQQTHFRQLAAIVDAKVRAVSGAIGTINESRQLLMAALLLADEMGNPPAVATPARPEPQLDAQSEDTVVLAARDIDSLAERIERLAQTLEKRAQDT
jgi:cell division protein ZapA